MHTSHLTSCDRKIMNTAMRFSFGFSLLILIIKCFAFYLTQSAAIFSDTVESIIHVFAVAFATYSMWYSLKPPDETHLYGHDKIGFFSAGFEGAMIIVAAFLIIFEAIYKFFYGIEIENIDSGLFFISIIVIINVVLGNYLIRKGKTYKSIILEANGKHILTDCWTSLAVILALLLVKFTGILLFDPLIAILAACNILWTGAQLINKSVRGLMDQADSKLHQQITLILLEETAPYQLEFHQLKHRLSGDKIFIEFHLLFPDDLLLGNAHEIASRIEHTLKEQLELASEITTHLELKAYHDEVHQKYNLPI